jgi:hypothetical protein
VKLFKPYNHIQIRYNTQEKENKLPPWRLIIDGKEFFANTVEVNGSVYSEESYVNGEKKYNIACHGRVTWQSTNAFIKAIKRINFSL